MQGEGREECTLKLMKFKLRAPHMHRSPWDAWTKFSIHYLYYVFYKEKVFPQIVNALGSTRPGQEKKGKDSACHFSCCCLCGRGLDKVGVMFKWKEK